MSRPGAAPPVSGGRRPLPAQHGITRLGKSPRLREWYRRLVQSAISQGLIDGVDATVLFILLDRKDAGETLGDVIITRAQVAAYTDREGLWGWSPEAIGRCLARLRDARWVDVVDVDQGQDGGWPLRRYRFRVPEVLHQTWFTILDNAGKRARTSRQNRRAQPEPTDRSETPNGDAPLAPIDELFAPLAATPAQNPQAASPDAHQRAAEARRQLGHRSYSPRAGP